MTINNFYSEPNGGPNEVQIIRVSNEERDAGKVSMPNLSKAVQAINRDGIVVIENATYEEHIDKVREHMMIDVLDMLAGKKRNVHYNFDSKEISNISQCPPNIPGFIFNDILANGIAYDIVSAMIGPHAQYRWEHGNTQCHSLQRQQVHADIRWDYWDHPIGITLNIHLQDVTQENGSTEIWLGSHKQSSLKLHMKEGKFRGCIDPIEVEKRREIRSPIYPSVKKGSIILRDMRLWHSGMPNFTKIPRIMLGIMYYANWCENEMRVQMPKSAKQYIEGFSKDGFDFSAVDYIDDELYDPAELIFDAKYYPKGEVNA